MLINDIATIGIITAGPGGPIEGFKEGLRELGFAEGRSIRFEQRSANGDLGRLPTLATELVRLNVDLIAVIGAVTARAVQKATTELPVVYSVVVDPVSDGLAASLEKPGGNMTGVTSFDPNQARTHVELLRAVLPALSRIAILSDQGVSDCLSASNAGAIQEFGLNPQVLRIIGPQPDLDGAFAAMDRELVEALIVLEEPNIAALRARIAELALARRLPTIFAREQIDAGGLFCYGTSLRSATYHMALCAKKILDGKSPRDIPIQTLSQHELVVNLQTARKLGLTVPSNIVNRAVRVIE
ncbi:MULTISPECIES: ABC transporter substrate-binding protein [unclassified Mesorhizobium]|uniref:ABC transporter substrate-binding protein n=1 Tax=unclassified Mesorhizobium TaxID=325217 RepID=UPI00333C6B7C